MATASACRVGRGVRDDEVLAAGLADDARIRCGSCDMIAPIVFHIALKTVGAAGEVHAGEIAMGEQRVRDHRRVAGHEVDDARRQARLLEQLHEVVGARASRVDAGFQTTVLPISAGAVGRLPPMAVKLNGVTA